MKVGDILRKKTGRVATIRMNETVAIAAQLMRAGNISALVVKDVVRTEGNTAVGMFTERDVVRALAVDGPEALTATIAELMSTGVTTCTSSTTVDSLMALMTEQRIRHVPVVDDGELSGMVSIGDVVKCRVGIRYRKIHGDIPGGVALQQGSRQAAIGIGLRGGV